LAYTNSADAYTVRDERAQNIKEQMKQAGVRWTEVDWRDHWYLFTLDKCLRFNMCSECTGRYINDSGKVKLVGGGYRLISFVLCNGGVMGNSEVKKHQKLAFPFAKPANV
jgi:hypothetical protein